MRGFIFIILLIPFTLHAGKANERLIGHDKVIYNPLALAKKSVSFEIEIEGLAEEISRLKSYGKVKSLRFMVTVSKLNKFKINIVGISSKFNDLQNNLKAKLLPYLELIFPTSLNKFYRGYSLKIRNDKVVAVDKTYLKPVRESYMTFQENGALKETRLKTPQGTQIINFSYSNGPSGFKRLLLEKVERKIIYGPSHLLSNTTVEYVSNKLNPRPKAIKTEFIFENKETKKINEKVNRLGENYKISNFKFN